MMARLFLLRHAKAGWAEAGQRDFDRALTASGRADAAAMGCWLGRHPHRADLVLSSSSKRTRQTVDELAPTLGGVETRFLDELYEASAAASLAIVRAQSPHQGVMVVGHNPVMEDLAAALLGDSGDHAEIEAGFPTCGLAILAFDGPLSEIAPGTCRLEAFVRPGDLK